MKTRPRPLVPVAAAGLAVLLLVASPLGAILVPQTREEFVRVVAAGHSGVKMESFVIERGFDEVYKTLEARSAPCLDKKVERSANVGYYEHSSSDYNPTLKRLGADRAEFTLQVIHNPRGVGGGPPPPGGLYIMAADLKRAGAGRTEVMLYRPTIGFKDITRGFMQWVEGKSSDCPKLK